MLGRELLYTGVTRAREELYIICEPESMTNGIMSQRIKGNTLAEKAEFFKGKLEAKNGGLLG
jgi:ATP-dependent exoDNAse (exonuclease V) alpha subunit